MAWREIPESRKFRKSRNRESGAVTYSGQRIYTGDLPDLIANQPDIGAEDFPYITTIGVSDVDIEPLTVSAAGISQAKMTVYYERVMPAATGRFQEGYRRDEFNCTTASMSFSSDLMGTPITRYELITEGPGAGKYAERPATLEVTGGQGLLTIYMVTRKAGEQKMVSGRLTYTKNLPLKWARHINYTNAKSWMSADRGQWKFVGARMGELEIPGQVVSSPQGWIPDTIPEIWLCFAYNYPGWNANQFGTKEGLEIYVPPAATQPASTQPSTQPAARQDTPRTAIKNYVVSPYIDFTSLFPMVEDVGVNFE